jgi:hypothetical protein
MTTVDELYELDRYELLDEFQKAFDVSISENFTRNTDLSIDTWNTADGYEVYVLSNGDYADNLNFESDVYYYQPSCAEIINRIVEVASGYGEKIYCSDIEMYFDDEQALIDALVDNFPDKYTNEDE